MTKETAEAHTLDEAKKFFLTHSDGELWVQAPDAQGQTVFSYSEAEEYFNS